MNITDTRSFFEEISRRGYEPRLRDATGAWQFDLGADGKWVIEVDKGRLSTRPAKEVEPDVKVTVRESPQDFLRLVNGENEENIITQFLRAVFDAKGDAAFAQRLQALIPLPEEPRAANTLPEAGRP